MFPVLPFLIEHLQWLLLNYLYSSVLKCSGAQGGGDNNQGVGVPERYLKMVGGGVIIK